MTENKDLSPLEQQRREHLRQTRPRVYEKVMQYEEKLKRGESIAIIQFQYDYRCNFGCEHCCITQIKKKTRHFTIESVKELSRQADEIGLSHFTITGGEPLIFPDLDELVAALDPQRFFIAVDSNGWFLDDTKAQHLKRIGVEKVHLSLDSLNPAEHDAFRKKPGSHARVLKAIDASLAAGLSVLLNTVVTKQRLHSQEYLDFLQFTTDKGVPAIMMFAKAVGSWAGNTSILLDDADLAYARTLEKKYNVFTHLTPAYGLDLGCIAVKRIISITRYGDVMPCPWIHISLGNVFDEPLKDILARGMNIKYFGKKQNTCLGSVDRHFIDRYLSSDKPTPVPYKEVFKADDYIK